MVVQCVFARHLAFVDVLDAHQCADARPGVVDLCKWSAGKCALSFVDQVLDVRRGRRDIGRIALVVRVGGADQRVAQPWDDKKQPPITLRKQHVGVVRRRWGDQMDAPGQAQERSTARAQAGRREVEPRPAGVDRQTCPRLDLATAQRVADHRADHRARRVSDEAFGAGVRQHHAALAGGIQGVFDDQALDQRDLPVVELPGALEVGRVQARLRAYGLRPGQPLTRWQALVEGQHVVQLHAGLELGPIQHPLAVHGHQKPQGLDEVRRFAQQHFPFAHVRAHQSKVEHLEVAQATMDQARRPRRRA